MDILSLLSSLIACPRVSRSEGDAADIMEQWMRQHGLQPKRLKNNLLLVDPEFDSSRPTILLNAHIDTVRPVASWTRNPHEPAFEGDRLYGIGSNDCGGGLVALLKVWAELTQRPRHHNFLYLASAEEEVSGKDGMELMVSRLPEMVDGWNGISLAIVGEPTGMRPAIAEKGLMVLDITAHGKSGHAARNEGVNAIYEALDDMQWIRSHRFERVSPLLGETRMQLTVVNSGTQHNVVPDECRMVVDVRSNELYSNEQLFDEISAALKSEVKARSFRLRSSGLPESHPFVEICRSHGLEPFGSPTLSDQALMPWSSLKIGPGESSRSHSADEYICVSEIERYVEFMLEALCHLQLP